MVAAVLDPRLKVKAAAPPGVADRLALAGAPGLAGPAVPADPALGAGPAPPATLEASGTPVAFGVDP
ncbi:MAG: hypothetical protein ABI427_03155 [Solirubrobacteraceae bacterium]